MKGISIKIRKDRDDTGVIGEYQSRKNEEDKMRVLEERASSAKMFRERQERIRSLKNQARDDVRAGRRAKYAGLYSFGSTLKKGARRTGGVVGRGLSKVGASSGSRRGRRGGDGFSSFNSLLGVSSPVAKKRRRTNKNRGKRIVIYTR